MNLNIPSTNFVEFFFKIKSTNKTTTTMEFYGFFSCLRITFISIYCYLFLCSFKIFFFNFLREFYALDIVNRLRDVLSCFTFQVIYYFSVM